MKNWHQLDAMALKDNLRIRRNQRLGDRSAEIWTTLGMPRPLVTVVPNEIDDIDGDKVARRMIEAALLELRGTGART